MNTKKAVTVLLLVLIAVYLSGCVEYQDSISDGMLSIPDDVLVIHINETYIYSIFGNYNTSSFIIDVAPLIVDGRDLVDPNGDRWVRD